MYNSMDTKTKAVIEISRIAESISMSLINIELVFDNYMSDVELIANDKGEIFFNYIDALRIATDRISAEQKHLSELSESMIKETIS